MGLRDERVSIQALQGEGMVKFIADIGANHNQDEDRLIQLIDLSASIGCWGVKPQYYRVKELFRGDTHMTEDWEFPKEFIPIAKKRCADKGLKFGVSIFHDSDFDYLNKYVDFWKISSYDVLRYDLIQRLADTDKQVFVSIGLARKKDMTHILSLDPQPTLFHCVSKYPAPAAEANLTVLNYPFIHGYSDHTNKPGVLYRACAMNIDWVEFHLSLDRQGLESKTSEHCWDGSVIKEVIDNVRVGESANRMRGVVADDALKNRCDPSDGMRPLLEIEGRDL